MKPEKLNMKMFSKLSKVCFGGFFLSFFLENKCNMVELRFEVPRGMFYYENYIKMIIYIENFAENHLLFEYF